jgi:hypothetical protein
LKQFLEFKIIEKHLNPVAQYRAATGPRLQPTGRGGLLCGVSWKSSWDTAWQPSPAGKTACAARCNIRTPRACRRGHHVGRRGDVFTGGSAVARRQQGVAGEHRWGPEVAPGKKSEDGAHRGGQATVGRREVAGAAAFNGGGVAPMVVDEGG